jgi:hypothetical protein
MKGSSLGRLRNYDLELVLYIVPLLSLSFLTVLMNAQRLSSGVFLMTNA